MRKVAVLLALTVFGSAANAITVNNGFVSGQRFLDFPSARQSAYVMGIVDGLLWSAVIGASQDTLAKLIACTENMTDQQIAAIVQKYLQSHPEVWHLPVHASVWNALRPVCSL